MTVIELAISFRGVGVRLAVTAIESLRLMGFCSVPLFSCAWLPVVATNKMAAMKKIMRFMASSPTVHKREHTYLRPASFSVKIDLVTAGFLASASDLSRRLPCQVTSGVYASKVAVTVAGLRRSCTVFPIIPA